MPKYFPTIKSDHKNSFQSIITLFLIYKLKKHWQRISWKAPGKLARDTSLTCTALLRKQLFCPGSFSRPLVGAKDSTLPGWYARARLPPGFRRNLTHAMSTQRCLIKARSSRATRSLQYNGRSLELPAQTHRGPSQQRKLPRPYGSCRRRQFCGLGHVRAGYRNVKFGKLKKAIWNTALKIFMCSILKEICID